MSCFFFNRYTINIFGFIVWIHYFYFFIQEKRYNYAQLELRAIPTSRSRQSPPGASPPCSLSPGEVVSRSLLCKWAPWSSSQSLPQWMHPQEVTAADVFTSPQARAWQLFHPVAYLWPPTATTSTAWASLPVTAPMEVWVHWGSQPPPRWYPQGWAGSLVDKLFGDFHSPVMVIVLWVPRAFRISGLQQHDHLWPGLGSHKPTARRPTWQKQSQAPILSSHHQSPDFQRP